MASGKFPNVQEYLKKWSEELVKTLRDSAVLQMNENKKGGNSLGDPQASLLVAGIRPVMSILGTTVEAHIIMPSQWYWLEHGRKPGKMPPEEPIVKWIVQRGFPINISNRRKSLLKKLGNRTVKKGLKQYSKEKAAKSLAYLIRRKIGKEGTRETNFYSNVVNSSLIGGVKATMKEKFNKDIRIDLITAIQ